MPSREVPQRIAIGEQISGETGLEEGPYIVDCSGGGKINLDRLFGLPDGFIQQVEVRLRRGQKISGGPFKVTHISRDGTLRLRLTTREEARKLRRISRR